MQTWKQWWRQDECCRQFCQIWTSSKGSEEFKIFLFWGLLKHCRSHLSTEIYCATGISFCNWRPAHIQTECNRDNHWSASPSPLYRPFSKCICLVSPKDAGNPPSHVSGCIGPACSCIHHAVLCFQHNASVVTQTLYCLKTYSLFIESRPWSPVCEVQVSASHLNDHNHRSSSAAL